MFHRVACEAPAPASNAEIAAAKARGDHFGGDHRRTHLSAASTVKKLEAIGRLAEFNINSSDGFRAVASVKGAIRSAKPVVTWTKRGAEAAQDVDDMASGRTLNKKPFYQKAWFKNAALTGIVAGGIYGARKAAQNRTQIPVPSAVANNRIGEGIRKINARHARGEALLEAVSRNLVEFDALAEAKGWDLRDARGKSARVFAPGAKRRDRREKTEWEKADTQRAVRNGLAVVAAGGLAATGILAYQNRNLRRAVASSADTARKGIAPVVTGPSGVIDFRKSANLAARLRLIELTAARKGPVTMPNMKRAKDDVEQYGRIKAAIEKTQRTGRDVHNVVPIAKGPLKGRTASSLKGHEPRVVDRDGPLDKRSAEEREIAGYAQSKIAQKHSEATPGKQAEAIVRGSRKAFTATRTDSSTGEQITEQRERRDAGEIAASLSPAGKNRATIISAQNERIRGKIKRGSQK